MPRPRKDSKLETRDYRHAEKRKNIPPAKIAAEGEVPKVKKGRYYYSPHLAPELRFDPTGKAARVLAVKEKAAQYLTREERELLDQALANQQPWLEWAGKKEEHDRGWFEVDPVALHIHERVSAQAIVRAAMREDLQRELFADPQLPYHKEVQFYRHDVDWANRLILGDSLEVMSSLARRENLAGKVQMIYIDPPYGIRFGSNFQPMVGKRDVKDRQEDLIREAEMVKAYRDAWNLGVHSYLEYLRLRLVAARNLLSPSGSLFVQIGDEHVHRIRSLLDEVFGAAGMVATIQFKKTGGFESGSIGCICDYILWYARDRENVRTRPLFEEKVFGEGSGDRYKSVMTSDGQMWPASAFVERDALRLPSGARLFLGSPLTSDGAPREARSLSLRGRTYMPKRNQHWKTTSDGLRRLELAERLLPTREFVNYCLFLTDFAATPVTNMWTDTMGTAERDKAYVVQTPSKVVERCILMTTDPGDLVLDPTCGSGTTAYVAAQWGRRWITIDTSRVSLAIARQRLLTAKYEHYRLREENRGPAGGFIYKTVPHITLKSIAQNQNLDPIFAKHEPVLDRALAECNRALEQVPDAVRDRCRRKLLEKEAAEGKRAVTDADRRRWQLPGGARGGGAAKWEHWEVPFDTDPEWPKALQNAVTAYRQAWRAKMDEVNACIAANADQEELVDQPEVVRNVVRVSGPFTVEGVRPEELALGREGLFDATPDEWEEGEEQTDTRNEAQNLRSYLARMVDLIRKDGVTFPNNQFRKFARVDALFEEKTGTHVHAEGTWEGGDLQGPNTVAIGLGPQYGPVTAEQVEDIIRGSRRYDELVIAGFSFDAEAAVTIQESKHPRLKIHMAHIRPDVSPGMDGLLKETPNSQLFTVFGQPEIRVRRHGREECVVELVGVDIFDPLKGEVRSTGAEKVAAWFLDSDYDGRCFCITQAFFPDQDAWGKIAKALGSQADEDAFEAFKGTVSLPFKPGKHRRIAVKVIDPRGNEVMTFEKLE